MIITRPKKFEEILASLQAEQKIFIFGCGECATTCKTCGEEEVLAMKKKLEEAGKTVTGYVVPDAPCNASQVKMAMAKNAQAAREADSFLVMACGLGVQSVQENDRALRRAHTANDTVSIGTIDASGVVFEELCSACGECVIEDTAGICPMTRCSKGLLNGPCGGQDKGKCEVDKDRDCAWVLIYKKLKETGKLDKLRKIAPAKDYSKSLKPHTTSIKK